MLSRRNVRALVARGAQVDARSHVWMMVTVHTLWLMGCWLEPQWTDFGTRYGNFRNLYWKHTIDVLSLHKTIVVLTGSILFVVGQSLRWWARKTLGRRWTIPIVIQKQEIPIQTGIYRWLRHPNYLGVMIEMVGLATLLQAWVTLLVSTVLNTAVLAYRIRQEGRAWRVCNAR